MRPPGGADESGSWGNSGSGKSTLGRALLERSAERGRVRLYGPRHLRAPPGRDDGPCEAAPARLTRTPRSSGAHDGGPAIITRALLVPEPTSVRKARPRRPEALREVGASTPNMLQSATARVPPAASASAFASPRCGDPRSPRHRPSTSHTCPRSASVAESKIARLLGAAVIQSATASPLPLHLTRPRRGRAAIGGLRRRDEEPAQVVEEWPHRPASSSPARSDYTQALMQPPPSPYEFTRTRRGGSRSG